MATVFKCDLCGKIFENKNHCSSEKNLELRVTPGDQTSPYETHRIKTDVKFQIKRWDDNTWKTADVCPECMVSIITNK